MSAPNLKSLLALVSSISDTVPIRGSAAQASSTYPVVFLALAAVDSAAGRILYLTQH